MNEQNERMLCRCPQGHKLRAGVALIGKMVRCPKCGETFVFGYAIRETVSDATVLRILGDARFRSQPEPARGRPPAVPCSDPLEAIGGRAG